MTKMLEDAVRKAQTLPPEVQDQIARLMMAFSGMDVPVIQLTPEEDADLAEADAELARGEFATDAEVAAVFAKYEL